MVVIITVKKQAKFLTFTKIRETCKCVHLNLPQTWENTPSVDLQELECHPVHLSPPVKDFATILIIIINNYNLHRSLIDQKQFKVSVFGLINEKICCFLKGLITLRRVARHVTGKTIVLLWYAVPRVF